MYDWRATEKQPPPTGKEAEAAMGGSDFSWIVDSTILLYLKPMRPSDLPEVLAIEQASYKSPWSRACFEAEMQKSYAELQVARLATEDGIDPLVGYGCFWLLAEEIQITNVAVHIDYRRQGVGRRIMLHMLQQGYEAGARLAFLEVRGSNQAARALYEGLGFVTVGERPNYYPEHREGALVLRLKLEPGSGCYHGT